MTVFDGMRKRNVKPVFICSLPRSGSTLLQRLLASDPCVSTSPEPWLVLPWLYALKAKGVFAEYNHGTAFEALDGFIKCTERGMEGYFEALGGAAMRLYEDASEKGAIYFLDKTPRYYLVLPELARMFPDAKFIFLFRELLQVFSSILNTWHEGQLLYHRHYIDLYKGPYLLSDGYRSLADRALKISFEELVTDPTAVLRRTGEYLELTLDTDRAFGALREHGISGKGDSVGASAYDRVTPQVTGKWKETFNTKLRRHVAKKYLSGLPESVLKEFGSDQLVLETSLSSAPFCPMKSLLDIICLAKTEFCRSTEAALVWSKFVGSERMGPMVPHL